MNRSAFIMRELANVLPEFSLTALAYDLTRVFTLIGILG